MSENPVEFGLPPVAPVELPIELNGAPIYGDDTLIDQSQFRGAQHPIEPEDKSINLGHGGENRHQDFRGAEGIQAEEYAVDTQVVVSSETDNASIQLTRIETDRDQGGHTGLPRAEGVGYLQLTDRTFPGEVLESIVVEEIEYLNVARRYFTGDPPVYTEPVAWADEAEYLCNDLVTSGGDTYQARVDHTASSLNEPPTSAFWKLVDAEVTVTVVSPGIGVVSYAAGDHVLVHSVGSEYACLPSMFMVKTSVTDTTPGFLEDEIVAGDLIDIYTTNIGPVEDGNEALSINHKAPTLVGGAPDFVTTLTGHNGVVIQGDAPTEGEQYLAYVPWEDRKDLLGHSEMFISGATQYVVFPNDDVLVKVSAADPAAGYLEDKITTVPAAGDSWLEQSTVAGQKVLLEHALLDDELLGENTEVSGLIGPQGGGVETDASPAAGYCYFEVPRETLLSDLAGHFDSETAVGNAVFSWLALPTDASTNDRIRWDGSKWVAYTWVKSVADIQISGTNLQVKYTTATGGVDASWTTVTGWTGTECA